MWCSNVGMMTLRIYTHKGTEFLLLKSKLPRLALSDLTLEKIKYKTVITNGTKYIILCLFFFTVFTVWIRMGLSK